MKVCEHLQRLKENEGVEGYQKFLTCLCIACPPHLKRTRDELGVKRSGPSGCHADKCRNETNGWKLLCCLHCIFFGCKPHAEEHFKEKDHPLSCTIMDGTLFCFACDDFIFDGAMESIRDLIQHGRRSAVVKRNMSPSPEEVEVIPAMKPSVLCVDSRSTIGLRGIVNLKNTCYLNCIIQVLAHTPILTDFFLSDCYYLDCKATHCSKPCLMACMTDVFQQFYNGERTPLLLTDLLGKMWLNAPHLASTDQQDAHEFLTAILEAMGLHFLATKSPCAIEEIFHGTLKSTVQCLRCGAQSITKEPFMEISLEVFDDGGITLEDCLLRYTQVEELAHTIDCSSCGKKRESSKQLELVTVPLILCMHFKRFQNVNHNKWEHHIRFSTHINLLLYSSSRAEAQRQGQLPTVGNHPKQAKARIKKKATSSTTSVGDMKIQSQVEELGAGGRLSPPLKKMSKVDFKNGLRSATFGIQSINFNEDFEYSLYAVVSHLGSSEGGHYITYFRNTHDTWFLCDDHIITKASLEEVLGCQAYMLFYHRTQLPHRPQSNSESSP